MDTEVLIGILEEHLKQAELQATEIYKITLRRLIGRLKEGYYLNKEDELIIALESVGFTDYARQIRAGLYV